MILDNRQFVLLMLCTFVFSSSLAQDIPSKRLLASVNDSVALHGIIDSIYKYSRFEPKRSLEYVNLYKDIIATKPEIPKHLDTLVMMEGHGYNSLGWNTMRDNSELAHRYIDTAKMIFIESADSLGIQYTNYNRGTVHRINGENEEAIKYYRIYADYFGQPYDSIRMANVEYQIGNVYAEMGNYEQSTNSYLIAATIDEKIGRIESSAIAYGAIGTNFEKIKQYDQALEYYNKAIQINEAYKDSTKLLNSNNNIGQLYSLQGLHEQAKKYFYKAMSYGTESSNAYELVSLYENLGYVHYLNIAYDSSQYYYDKALEIINANGNKKQLYLIQHKMGLNYFKTNEIEKSVKLLKVAFAAVDSLKDIGMKRTIASDLSMVYEYIGQFKKALDFKNIYVALNDSLINQETSTAVAQMTSRFESEKKEAKIKQLELEDTLNETQIQQQKGILSVFGVSLAGLGFFLWRLNAQKKRITNQNVLIQTNLSEKELLLKEIHHRVKNNLQVISSLLNIQSRQVKDEKAKEAIQEGRSRVHSMSLIHQKLYKKDNLTGVDMRDYLEDLSQDLFATYNVSNTAIDLTIDVDNIILDVETVIPIGLIVNELLSNVLKYAFPNNQQGKLNVSLKEVENRLNLIVSDNGIGLTQQQKETKDDTFGHSLIKAFKNKLDAEVLVDGTNGTTVQVLINKYKMYTSGLSNKS